MKTTGSLTRACSQKLTENAYGARYQLICSLADALHSCLDSALGHGQRERKRHAAEKMRGPAASTAIL